MGDGIHQAVFAAPSRWFLCFSRSTPRWWLRWLACGRYKHVSAFGCVSLGDGQIVWMFYNVHLYGTAIVAALDADALPVMELWADNADLIAIRPGPRGTTGYRLGFWCVPAIKHLIGIRSGALRPDTLWRDCLRNGGEVIHGRREAELFAATA